MERSEPRSRGVRLSDLDRSKAYVIAYSGRRWEVVGPVEERTSDGRHARTDAGGLERGGSPEGAAPGPHATRGAPPDAGGQRQGVNFA